MGLSTKIARIEQRRGVSKDQKAAAHRRHLEFLSMLERDHVMWTPEYRRVTREDCQDDEVWNDVRHTLAMADGDFREADRLESLPAPRRAEKDAWIEAAPSTLDRLARLGQSAAGEGQRLSAALARTRARLAAEPRP